MLSVDVSGRGSPVVLLHGVGASRVIWRRMTPLLVNGRRVIAPDLPGFGESPAPAGDFDLTRTADALAAGLEGYVSEPFDLVGNSLGGAVALLLARRRPELVRRLVLAAPAGLAPYPWPAAAVAGRVAGPLTTVRRVVGGPLAAHAVARRIALGTTVAAPERLTTDAARTMLQASRGSRHIGAAVAAVMSADLGPELAALTLPVGFIWGERDRLVPIRALHGLLPAPLIETIPGTAHVPQLERPDRFVAALTRLWARLERTWNST